MNRYQVSYLCFFSGHHRQVLEVEASNKLEALKKALAIKRNDPNASIEFGGVAFDTFRVDKKLPKR